MSQNKENKPKRKIDEPEDIADACGELIQQSLMQYNDEADQIVNKQKVVDMTFIRSFLTEYLDSFLIIGYNLNNDPIYVSHASDGKSEDALSERLQKTFIKHMITRGSSMGTQQDLDDWS